jgi:flavorubredoxin
MVNRFRKFSKNKETLKKGQLCAICGEGRCIELCHIIPAYFLQHFENNLVEFSNDDNIVFLCKTHHYCFDNMLLTDEELEKIYQSRKWFIDNVLIHFINAKFKVGNEDMYLSMRAEKRINNFRTWLVWVGRVFFIKLN